jgi:mono/diheme cytochrome c family protein
MTAPLRRPAAALVVLALAAGVAAPALADRGSLVQHGMRDYRDNCAVCHGMEGDGDGPIASTLTVAPGELTTLAARNGGAFPYERVFEVIDGRAEVAGHGTADMPVWGTTFRLEAERAAAGAMTARELELMVAGRIHALTLFLREIQTEGEAQAE